MIRYLRPLTLVLLLSFISILTNAQSTQIQTPCKNSATTTSAPCQSLNQNGIEFQGLNALDTSEVLKSFREHGLLRGDATPSEKKINEAAKLLKARLADRGYMDASVAGLRIGESNGVRFVVDEGMKYAITSLEFVGNKHFTSEDLGAHLRECLNEYESERGSGYDREIFDYTLHVLSMYMRSQGYLQAQLGEPRITVVGAGLKVTVEASEGLPYRLGELKFDGVQAISLAEIRSLLPMTKGDIANGERIGKWLFEDVKRLYGEKGFIQYTAEPDPLFKNNPGNPEEGIVDLNVHIDEGKQFSLRSLTFEGADLSQKQLAEFFVLNVGDVFNQRLLQETVTRLNKAGLFEPIEVDRDFTYKTDEENGTVALVLNLRKKTAGDIH
jgi:outer membrane protein insertion porin family